jgi:hypothetical protein
MIFQVFQHSLYIHSPFSDCQGSSSTSILSPTPPVKFVGSLLKDFKF